MHTPLWMTLRVAVVLSALVLVPLAAVPGGPLPGWFDAACDLCRSGLDAVLANPSHAAQATERLPTLQRHLAAPVGRSMPTVEVAQVAVSDSQAAGRDRTVSTGVASTRIDRREFAPVADRLRELGVTYYRLETWGAGDVYRFACDVPLAGPRGATRRLEATDAKPLEAARRVLHQLETWRCAR